VVGPRFGEPFWCIGILPRRMGNAVLAWKLVALSRPAILTRLSKTIRRVTN
jgi:hypothetical protein